MALAAATRNSRMVSIAPFTGLATAYGKAICKVLELSLRDDCAVPRWPGLRPDYMYLHVPTGLVPQEDQNYFIVVVQAPPGASLSYTTEVSPAGGKEFCWPIRMYSVRSRSPVFRFPVEVRPNYGLVFAPLKPISEREGQRAQRASEIVHAPGAEAFRRSGSDRGGLRTAGDQGIGSFGGFQFELQDLGRNTLQDLDR